MNQENLIEFLKNEGYYNIREIPNRGLCGLKQFLTTVGLVEGLTFNGYSGRYCFPNNKKYESIISIETWDGKNDPLGAWIVYKGNRGEYINPNKNKIL